MVFTKVFYSVNSARQFILSKCFWVMRDLKLIQTKTNKVVLRSMKFFPSFSLKKETMSYFHNGNVAEFLDCIIIL